jgi:ribonuclease HII
MLGLKDFTAAARFVFTKPMAKAKHPLWSNDKDFLQTLESQQASLGLVGIDEAGRGALAGPVHAAAFWLSHEFYQANVLDPRLQKIGDSKAMRPAQREAAADDLQALASGNGCAYGVAAASVEEIEKLNILGATRLAMSRAIAQLKEKSSLHFSKAGESNLPLWQASPAESATGAGVALLVDGLPLRPFVWEHRALVGGDALSLAIAAASVIAKVTRDRHMRMLAQRFPQYGFDAHAGYGTKAHRQAILSHGPSPEHRTLFLRKVLAKKVSNLASTTKNEMNHHEEPQEHEGRELK